MMKVRVHLPALRCTRKCASKASQSTVDTNEIASFQKLSENWWDEKKGTMKPLHSMNELRVPLIRNGLVNTGKLDKSSETNPKCFQGLKMLDVGCGGGILTLALARLGGTVTGLDPGLELIKLGQEQAKKILPEGTPIQFVGQPIEEHAATHKDHYDVVVSSEVIEHVTHKEDFVHHSVQTLKPGGSIFFTTLNKTTASWLVGIVGAEYALRLLPVGTHHWDKFITPADLSQLLRNECCDTRQITGMGYNPLTNKWFWIRPTSVNYALHATKRN